MEQIKNKKQSFMAGVLTILIAQIIIKLLGLIYRLVITNIPYFGDEGNGLYGAGFQIYMLLLAIASIGVPGAIAKLVSERIALGKYKEAHRIFKVAFVLFGIIGLVGSLGLFLGARFISANLIGNPDIEGVLVALSPSIFFVAISAVIRGYFNGMYNMKATSNSQTFEQFFKSILTVGIVLLIYLIATTNPLHISEYIHIPEENITMVMAAGANLASTLATIISFMYLYGFYVKRRKEIWKNIRESKEEYTHKNVMKIVKTILYLSIPMSLASIISAINRNVDTFTVINGLKVALSGIIPIEEIANEATRLYGILSGKVDMLIGLPLSLNVAFATALVPAVAEAMAVKDEKTAVRRISFSIRTTILIGLPCAIGLCILAKHILNLLFPGAPAIEAPLLLQISSFTIIFTVLNQTIGGALQGLGKVYVPAISLVSGAIIKLILNLILIPMPSIGVNGAAIGSVACHIVATIIGYTVLRKTIKLDINFTQMITKPFVVTGIMGTITYLSQKYLSIILGRPRIATIVSIILAIISYLLLIVLFKVFSKEDYHMLPFGDKIYSFLVKIKLIKA